MDDDPILDLASLAAAYDAGATPSAVMACVLQRIESHGQRPVWISAVPRDEVLARARKLEGLDRSRLPLYGVPFAVKDNIDVAGMATTAACPAYSYVAQTSATVVRKLEDAGAILVGKTNLDQFATGLVGVRSPYGACSSVFDSRYISGGSSSGSAVAVAKGLVSFALGTDTAGSGRVPAAFNNLIGFKPTRGRISAAGVVPACRTLDCVSVFSLTSADAAAVLRASSGFDSVDSYSRSPSAGDGATPWLVGPVRFGVPRADQLEFFGDAEAARLYEESVLAFEAVGGHRVEFDLDPFLKAASLLYSGPWVAERLAGLKDFFAAHAEDVHPVVRSILSGAARHSAVDAFLGQYALESLRKTTARVWDDVDVLLLPTTGTTYTSAELEADPIRLNTNLGLYTNFVNLLDLAAVALPAGFRSTGLPFGVTIMGKAWTDEALLLLADRLHRQAANQTLGGLAAPLASTPACDMPVTPPGCTLLAVVGAHLTGQPLNHQLTTRGARLARTTRTANGYRLYALPGTIPPKPGLVRSPGFTGPGIEVEVWAIPTSAFGAFVAEVPPPLGIGSVELADGSTVKGFLCEPFAISSDHVPAQSDTEITHFGGWRAYLAQN